MKILYFTWNENPFSDMKRALNRVADKLDIFNYPVTNYINDPAFERELCQKLLTVRYDAIFSFDYFLPVARVAEKMNIKYISWIYDCPHLPLYAASVRNPNNYIFAFDRVQCQWLKKRGAVHVYHLPLAVDCGRLVKQCGIDWDKKRSYDYDISFVGSLYENNQFRKIRDLPEFLRGYFAGIIAAQEAVWGCDIIGEVLTEDVVRECLKYMQFTIEDELEYSPKILLQQMIQVEVTARERKKYMERLGSAFDLALFGASKGVVKAKQLKEYGYISYMEKVPAVFWKSKINLNITARCIPSGIPIRALDVMGAGGFLMSNFQPELAEFFVPGEEFVYFEDIGDMQEKVRYYLKHEEERERIARRGWEKVQGHNYTGKVQEMFRNIMSSDF